MMSIIIIFNYLINLLKNHQLILFNYVLYLRNLVIREFNYYLLNMILLDIKSHFNYLLMINL